jgi:hypothetical protein
MQSIRLGGFQPPCPKATVVFVRLVSISCKQQREQLSFTLPSNIRYCGSRDEPPIPASGRNRIGGEIKRNEQSPLWGVATIELADTHRPGAGLGARSPQRPPLLDVNLNFILENKTVKRLKEERFEALRFRYDHNSCKIAFASFKGST